MATTERDLALIQEELRCLRGRFRTTISTAGGTIPSGSITVPGSSVFPDSYFDNCECAGVNVVNPDPLDICPPTENGITSLGSLAGSGGDTDNNNPLSRGIYVFDAVAGVYFRNPKTDVWDSRNTGLSDITLNHGGTDPWWKSRTDGNAETSAILWTCGDGRVLRSATAGLGGWEDVTPTSTITNLKYLQILADPFKKKRFYTIGWDKSSNRAFLYKTENDGQSWTEEELTTFNSANERIPIWMALSGNGGSTLFLTTWYKNGTTEELDLIKITTNSLSPLTSLGLGATTELEYKRKIFTASPATPLDDEASVFLFGRMFDPDSLGVAHVVKSTDGASTFAVEVNDWGADWAGSMKVSTADGSGQHKYYAMRNAR